MGAGIKGREILGLEAVRGGKKFLNWNPGRVGRSPMRLGTGTKLWVPLPLEATAKQEPSDKGEVEDQAKLTVNITVHPISH